MDKLSNEDLLNRIENEGIGYAIQHYYGKLEEERALDEIAGRLWNNAYDSLKLLQDYLEKDVNSGEEEVDDEFAWGNDDDGEAGSFVYVECPLCGQEYEDWQDIGTNNLDHGVCEDCR